MKLFCLQENLKNYLNTLERIASKNINFPIISNILLEAKDNKLKISSTDLEIALQIEINSKIEEDGRVVIPAKLLADFVNNLPNKKIEITSLNNKNTSIVCDNFKSIINGYDPEEFPLIPQFKKEREGTLYFNEFKKGLLKLINIIPLTNIRPEILGVYVKTENNELKMVATDSFRLGEVTLNQNTKIYESFILPLKTTQELIRIFDQEESVNFLINQNQIFFYTDKIEFTSRLIDGDYPSYQSIIPKNFTSSFLISKEELTKNIKIIGLFSSRNNDIILEIEKDFINIKSMNTEKGEGSSKIPIKLIGEPLKIVLNYKFLIDGLNNIENNNIFFGFNSSTTPVLIKDQDKTDYFYVIMPIRS